MRGTTTPRRFRWLLLIAPITFAYLWFVTYGTWNLVEHEFLNESFDSLAASLLHGEASVDPAAITWEGFNIDGKTYIYFGPLPAILRILPNMAWPGMYGYWPRISTLLAASLAVMALYSMLSLALRQNSDLSERWRGFYLVLFTCGFAWGTPLFHLVSCARIYHEATIWGLSLALCSIAYLTKLLFESNKSSTLCILCVLTGATLLARVTFFLPVILATSTLLIFGVKNAKSSTERGFLISSVWGRALLATPLVAAVAFQGWYNFARFKSVWRFIDYRFFYLDPSKIGGEFNIWRIPSALYNYFWYRSGYISSIPPFIHVRTVDYVDNSIFFDWKEQVISLSFSSGWLVLLGLCGFALIWRKSHSWRVRLVATALLGQSLLILTYLFVTQRYASEFLPFLTFGTLIFLKDTRGLNRLRVAVPISLLVIFSIAATTLSTLDWNMTYNGDNTYEYKKLLRTNMLPQISLPAQEAKLVYLDELALIAETHTFTGPRFNLDYDGGNLDINGKTFEHGIGMHSLTHARFAVPADATVFQAIVGVADSARSCDLATVKFRIEDPDGKRLFESETLNAFSLPQAVRVELKDLKELVLVLDDAGDGIDCDHGNWAEAAFVF